MYFKFASIEDPSEIQACKVMIIDEADLNLSLLISFERNNYTHSEWTRLL